MVVNVPNSLHQKVAGKVGWPENWWPTLECQGQYQVVEMMHQRALKGRENALGMEHSATLRSVESLASVLQYQGKYEAAEVMK